MKKLDINYIINFGIKEALLDKLGQMEKQYLMSFMMDHSTSSNLLKMSVQLISMEIQGKHGALYLASLGLATPMQLKNLSAQQIKMIVENHRSHKDLRVTANLVKRTLIVDQQDKLYSKTGGVKGGYSEESFDDEEKWL